MFKEAEIRPIDGGYEIRIGDGEVADFSLYVKSIGVITHESGTIPIENLTEDL